MSIYHGGIVYLQGIYIVIHKIIDVIRKRNGDLLYIVMAENGSFVSDAKLLRELFHL